MYPHTKLAGYYHLVELEGEMEQANQSREPKKTVAEIETALAKLMSLYYATNQSLADAQASEMNIESKKDEHENPA